MFVIAVVATRIKLHAVVCEVLKGSLTFYYCLVQSNGQKEKNEYVLVRQVRLSGA